MKKNIEAKTPESDDSDDSDDYDGGISEDALRSVSEACGAEEFPLPDAKRMIVRKSKEDPISQRLDKGKRAVKQSESHVKRSKVTEIDEPSPEICI